MINSQSWKSTVHLVMAIFFSVSMLFAHDVSEEPPTWTHYLRGGVAHTRQSGGLGYYRIKRIHYNTFHDLRLLGYFIHDETLAILRYKSSRKFDVLPQFYKFSIISLRHSSKSNLTIRYHYNQGFGAFIFQFPSTHLTTELALSYDMSDYLHDTRKTSYLKGGLFWDVDIGKTSLALDFEYFHQISDIIPGEEELTRYEISSELNVPVRKGFTFTVGYEQEFYVLSNIQNVWSVYVAFGFKQLLPLSL